MEQNTAMNTFTLNPDQELATRWWNNLSELKRKYLAFKYYQKDDELITLDQYHSIWEKEMFKNEKELII